MHSQDNLKDKNTINNIKNIRVVISLISRISFSSIVTPKMNGFLRMTLNYHKCNQVMTEMKADISDFISWKQIHTDPGTWYTVFYLANVLFSFSLKIEFQNRLLSLDKGSSKPM